MSFLYFLLAIIGILALVRLLPLLFLIGGTAWLWHSRPWVLISALLLGALLGIVRALRNQSESKVNHQRAGKRDEYCRF